MRPIAIDRLPARRPRGVGPTRPRAGRAQARERLRQAPQEGPRGAGRARSSTSSASGGRRRPRLPLRAGRPTPEGFPPAVRLKALEVLADAALTRDAPPDRRPRRPRPPDPAERSEGRPGRPAGRDPAGRALEGRGDRRRPPRDRRVEGRRRADPRRGLRRHGRDRRQAGPRRRSRRWPRPIGPAAIRIPAVAALARLDVDAAADRVAGVLAGAADRPGHRPADGRVPRPPGGGREARRRPGPPASPRADNAKLGAPGGSTPSAGPTSRSSAVLSKAAGIEAEAEAARPRPRWTPWSPRSPPRGTPPGARRSSAGPR